MTGTYRVGNHQPQNVYRGEQYIGVMFTAEDAALTVEALNEVERLAELHRNVMERLMPAAPADSCTCPFMVGLDPACPVHQGRRARGPKPPPLGPGCVEVVHHMPYTNPGVVSCCGRTPFELPATDRMTGDQSLVTCSTDLPGCDGSGRTCPRHGAVM